MKLDGFCVLFLVTGLVLTLIAASPVLTLIPLPRSGERFSELWILGPEHRAENYPSNIEVGEQYGIYVGVGNQLSELAYYVIYVKVRNQTQLLPNSTLSEPSPLNSVYEFRFVLSDGKVWEAPLIFAFEYVSLRHNTSLIQNISINGIGSPVNCTSTWDSDRNGFYYQMFFELWLYNGKEFQYNNRFVDLWLNMTS